MYGLVNAEGYVDTEEEEERTGDCGSIQHISEQKQGDPAMEDLNELLRYQPEYR